MTAKQLGIALAAALLLGGGACADADDQEGKAGGVGETSTPNPESQETGTMKDAVLPEDTTGATGSAPQH